MNDQRTEHLVFIPCSIAMARSLLLHAEALRKHAPIYMPDCFPTTGAKATLPYIIERLEQEEEPLSWLWFVIEVQKKSLIGELILGKKKSDDPTLQFTFTFDTFDHEIAFGEECVDWLLSFLANKKITYVITEMRERACMAQSILEQKGFRCINEDGFMRFSRRINEK